MISLTPPSSFGFWNLLFLFQKRLVKSSQASRRADEQKVWELLPESLVEEKEL